MPVYESTHLFNVCTRSFDSREGRYELQMLTIEIEDLSMCVIRVSLQASRRLIYLLHLDFRIEVI